MRKGFYLTHLNKRIKWEETSFKSEWQLHASTALLKLMVGKCGDPYLLVFPTWQDFLIGLFNPALQSLLSRERVEAEARRSRRGRDLGIPSLADGERPDWHPAICAALPNCFFDRSRSGKERTAQKRFGNPSGLASWHLRSIFPNFEETQQCLFMYFRSFKLPAMLLIEDNKFWPILLYSMVIYF